MSYIALPLAVISGGVSGCLGSRHQRVINEAFHGWRRISQTSWPTIQRVHKNETSQAVWVTSNEPALEPLAVPVSQR
jgi:hypothetical protein